MFYNEEKNGRKISTEITLKDCMKTKGFFSYAKKDLHSQVSSFLIHAGNARVVQHTHFKRC
jgi:hypothetical protein